MQVLPNEGAFGEGNNGHHCKFSSPLPILIEWVPSPIHFVKCNAVKITPIREEQREKKE